MVRRDRISKLELRTYYYFTTRDKFPKGTIPNAKAMNVINTKKQVLNKELSTNPVKEILAEIESKFEVYDSNFTS